MVAVIQATPRISDQVTVRVSTLLGADTGWADFLAEVPMVAGRGSRFT